MKNRMFSVCHTTKLTFKKKMSRDITSIKPLMFSNFPRQDTHRLYKQKLEEVTRLQNSCSSAIARQRKKLKDLTVSLTECVLIRRPVGA